jgi:flavin reductase
MNHLRFEDTRTPPHAGGGATLLGFPGAPTDDTLARERFVDAMKGAATGVTVVTTSGSAGRFGLTVSAFASVSADPPMVLVCVNGKSPVGAAIVANRRFCVNVLGLAQRGLADTFAGTPVSGAPYDFARGAWSRGATGAPMLDGAVASFDCALATALNAGSHSVFVGLVKAAIAGAGEPLVYQNRAYRALRRAF